MQAASSSEASNDTEDETVEPPADQSCDELQVEPNHKALSVQQRQQLRIALKQQLEDLQVQQAAQGMHILGL